MSDNPLSLPTVRPVYGSDRNWFDPRLQLANCFQQITDVPFVLGPPILLVPANPRRWAIGFFQASGFTDLMYAPWSDATAFKFDGLASKTTVAWYTISDYGPLICSAWYGSSASSLTARVIEIMRN